MQISYLQLYIYILPAPVPVLSETYNFVYKCSRVCMYLLTFLHTYTLPAPVPVLSETYNPIYKYVCIYLHLYIYIQYLHPSQYYEGHTPIGRTSKRGCSNISNVSSLLQLLYTTTVTATLDISRLISQTSQNVGLFWQNVGLFWQNVGLFWQNVGLFGQGHTERRQ